MVYVSKNGIINSATKTKKKFSTTLSSYEIHYSEDKTFDCTLICMWELWTLHSSMLLTPSLSPSSPLYSPPPLPPPPLPVVLRPLPPPPTPASASPPPLLASHLAPISTPPPIPAAVAISPVTTPTPAVVTSPPPLSPTPPAAATKITPLASPPLPAPPLVIIPSPLLPKSSPPPPQQPSKPLPSTPLPTAPPRPPSVVLPPPPPPAASRSTRVPKTPTPFRAFPLRPPLPPPTSTPPPLPPAASHSIGAPNTPGFFQAFPPPSPPPPPPAAAALALTANKGGLAATKHRPHSPIGLIVASIGVTVLLFVVFALVCICFKGRRRKHKPSDTKIQQCSSVTKDGPSAASMQQKQQNVTNSATVTADTALNPSSGIFTYEELVLATNGFSESNLIGQGGFGYVYKGRLLTGQDVAVKKLKAGSRQGEREFRAEVETISRLHHKHLVSLVGYCINGAERLLVYEFVPNRTLEFHLHENRQPVIVWESRLKIAIGSAKGLAYLHEDCSPTIIHRDIKAANILLDMRFEAKVSDFGLAKIFFDESPSITHISTRVMGTFGYLAPEYVLTGKLTDKSDVYSYGVMLLELITGRPPIIQQSSSTNHSLVDWARPLLGGAIEANEYESLVDERLNGAYNKSQMANMVTCAAACLRQSAWLRPRMIQVVRALEDNISLPYLEEGSRFWKNSFNSTSSATFIQNAQLCNNNDSFSETTSEYGLNPSGSTTEIEITPKQPEYDLNRER
ncbi:proline-rich receptor-like protein kinase PERK3 [Gossypium arboreum]|nr:proline-rich receptor-like protein kinase PERK3 [Gossypium arboreum]